MNRELVELWRKLVEHHRTHVPMQSLITDDVIREAIATRGEGAGLFRRLRITLASCSYYHGSSIDRANIRAFEAEYECYAWEPGDDSDESVAWVILGEAPGTDEEDDEAEQIKRLRALLEALDRLDEYPLIADDYHVQLEMQLADEAWDWWLRREVIDELCTALGVASLDEAPRTPEFRDDSRDIDDIVREVYYSFEGNEWLCDTANSAINLRHDDAVQHVLNTVFATES